MEFRKQKYLDEAEEPESEPTERTMKDLNFTEALRGTEAGISLSEDTYCNEQRASAVGQRIVRTPVFLL